MAPLRDESTLYDEALAALARGDLKQASTLCQSLFEGMPISARGYFLMSSLFKATGNYRKAYDYASLATQMDSCVASYHLQQGMILFVLKSYEQAFASFERAASLDGANAEACVWAGDCMKALERYDEAHGWYARAKNVAPTEKVMLAEAECYLQAGDYAHATAQVEACIDAHAYSAQAHYLRAMCALSANDVSRAQLALTKALSLDATHVNSHFYLALVTLAAGDDAHAIAQALQALTHMPTHVPSLLLLGNIFIKKGDSESAIKAFSHVLAMVPDHVLVWQQLMQLYATQNRLAEGQERLKETIGRMDNPVALRHIRALHRSDVPPYAPKEFVSAIYDQLATAFEYWLMAASDTRHIEHIAEALCEREELAGKRHLAVLDIGCNIGKMAQALSDITAIRVGVELSPEMAKLARRSKCYDVVYEWDALDYVMGSEATFDLVVSTGALRWMGNLQPFFHGVRNVMHMHSLFAFVVSKEHSSLAYTVAQDGRYHHNIAYIQDVAQAEGFTLLHHQELLWFDAEDGVISRHLFILKKMTLH